ncbi:MAG: hypothetical protein LQ338_005561 [Usnochroma carphineum]|nr:MAG: hypothetical protein LQ338_005561 [Usnochroma carphineum]
MSTPSNFFTLPFELRSSIYFRAIMLDLLGRDVRFEEDDAQDMLHHNEYDYSPEHPTGIRTNPQRVVPVLYILPSLLLVSKQVRAEAEQVLYSRCTLVWRFRKDTTILENLAHIPSRNFQFIHAVEYYHAVFREEIDTSEALREVVADLINLLPNLRNLTLNLRFNNATSTSSSDPKAVAHNFEKLLGPLLGRIATVDLYLWWDGWYGDECDGYPQPSVRKIRERLSGQLPTTSVGWYGPLYDYAWVSKIHNLDNPIMLMGKEHPAKACEGKLKDPPGHDR